ncbi:MAG: hypothetical protein WDO15_11475 [Bacteroidota bacterium]
MWAAARKAIYSQDNGVSWAAADLGPFGEFDTLSWQSVIFVNGLFMAISGFVPDQSYIITSPDGITWTRILIPVGQWNSLAYGNGIYLAVAEDGKVLRSIDGVKWRLINVPGFWKSVAYGVQFVAVESDNSGDSKVISSFDGLSWTPHPLPDFTSLQDVVYDGSKYVAGGHGGLLAISETVQ